MPQPAPIRAGELRFRGQVQQLVNGTWANYTGIWFDLEITAEGESERTSRVTARWTPKLDSLVGLRYLNKGFSIWFSWRGAKRRLLIDQVTSPSSRKREVEMQCREVEA